MDPHKEGEHHEHKEGEHHEHKEGEHHHHHHHHHHHKEGEHHEHKEGEHHHHHNFADVQKWIPLLEEPERDNYQQTAKIIELTTKNSDVVADIGAGTGYLPLHLSKVAHKVYAVDLELNMVNHMKERFQKIENIIALQASADDPKLPEPVDVIFSVNTYHHLEDRVNYFRKVKQHYLKPAGKLIIVDWKMGELKIGPPGSIKIPPEQIIAEITQAGFTKLDVPFPDTIYNNNFAFV